MKLIAVKDKILVNILVPKEKKTDSGVILTQSVIQKQEPQLAGKVISYGNMISFDINIGDIILMHRNAGMDIIIDQKIYKVLKDDEVYCILKN